MEAVNKVVFTNRGIKMTYNASTAEEKLDIIDLPRLRALVESRTEAGGHLVMLMVDHRMSRCSRIMKRHFVIIS